jgi:hypothetical protein
VSETESIDVPLDLIESDVKHIKDQLFQMISNGIFEATPEERLEKLKIATMLESMDLKTL